KTTRTRVITKPRSMEPRKYEKTPMESASSFIQANVDYGESSDRAEEFKVPTSPKRSLRKVSEYVDNLAEFDPDRVVISTMKADVVSSMAVVEVDNPSDNPAVSGGVNDSRMGVTDGGSCCFTCRQVHCPGHIGK